MRKAKSLIAYYSRAGNNYVDGDIVNLRWGAWDRLRNDAPNP